MAYRTVLIAQSPLFRAGLKHIMDDGRFAIVHETDALPSASEPNDEFDLILLQKPREVREIEPDLKAFNGTSPRPRIVLMAATVEIDQLAVSFAAGVDGFLLEEISQEALLESLQLVMLGEKVFPSQLAALIGGQTAHGPATTTTVAVDSGVLSRREADIVARLARGLPNKSIAEELTITESTVKVHLKSILKKLQVSNRTQAAIWALNNGVIAPPKIFN